MSPCIFRKCCDLILRDRLLPYRNKIKCYFYLCLFSAFAWQSALRFEPPHDKTNKMTVRPAKTQISLGIPAWASQPGHPPSLISVFTVHLKKARVLNYPLSAQQRLIRLGGCPVWSQSSLGAHAILLLLSRSGSFPHCITLSKVQILLEDWFCSS